MEKLSFDQLQIMDPAGAFSSLGEQTLVDLMIDGMDPCLKKHLTDIKISLEDKNYAFLKTQLQSLKGSTAYTKCDRLGKAVELLKVATEGKACLLYTSPSPRDRG
eukprot:TRINITY_DN19654_c0_g1_i1.p2 TRINITY_DN19654_c0_g1~~TRINITY_DN19654_c0_g1_i1.p2  ORF type:complete len:105 (-),score=28.63 TRINITY_DN19654_c0_g1_i1:34-348(-)